MSREEAYEIVQSNATTVWNKGVDFQTELKNDPRVTSILTTEELESNFDMSYHLKHVNTIFEKVFS